MAMTEPLFILRFRGLQDVDGFDELPGAPGAAAELAHDVPGLELGVGALAEALRADLSGTGVVVTQVCPGPVDSEFDQIAGSAGGMTGGPP